MAFGKPKAAEVALTNAQQAERHLRLAEQYLTRSKKAGRIEYHVQLATTANAHATLALFYQNADPSLVIVRGDGGDDEDESLEESDQDEEPRAVVAPSSPAPAVVAPCCSKAGPDGRLFGPCASN